MQNLSTTIDSLLSAAATTESASEPADWRPTLDEWHPSLTKAADLASQFVRDMADNAPGWWLTLNGMPGCGKTMIARQIAEEARKHNPGNRSIWLGKRPRPRVVWVDAPEFADRMRAGEYSLPESLAGDFLVVIDDLGAARDNTSFVADGLYRLANARLGKWTVWTTNLLLREIGERIDARVSSRLIRDRNRMHRIEAEDYGMRAVKAQLRAAKEAGAAQ